jgi:hypothetical protein
MNKIEKLKKRHDGYKAACEAIRATKPGELVVKFGNNNSQIQFNPDDDHVRLHIESQGWIKIPLLIIPELAKALQGLLEEER